MDLEAPVQGGDIVFTFLTYCSILYQAYRVLIILSHMLPRQVTKRLMYNV